MRRAGLVLVLFAACAAGPSPRRADEGRVGGPTVRVLLEAASARRSVRLGSTGPYRLIDRRSGEVLDEGARLDRAVALAGAGIDGSFRVVARTGRLTVDGVPYPGSLLLVSGESGSLLVNETDLESYLPGVLAGEMNRSFPPGALRAQAIAARTYALNRIRAAPGADHHLYDSTRSQRYLGFVESGGGALTRAAADTRGIVLQWAGRLVPAYYHSTCGGRTAAAREVLGGPDIPPLVGAPCGFCGDSPKYRWTARFPLSEAGPSLGLPGPFRTAAVAERSPGGRARAVRFDTTPPRTLRATDLRAMLGPGRLPSTAIGSLRIEGSDLVVEGAGFGHGAGLCQYGARGMARAGAGTADILSHYYPAANRTRIY